MCVCVIRCEDESGGGREHRRVGIQSILGVIMQSGLEEPGGNVLISEKLSLKYIACQLI